MRIQKVKYYVLLFFVLIGQISISAPLRSSDEKPVKSENKEKALSRFEKAYQIAKSTNNENTAYFEKK